MTRTSTFFVSRPPTRRISLSSRTRSSFDWRSSGRSPISSRSRVPSCADLEEPGPVGGGAGEGASHVAEQLALEQLLGNGGAIDGGEVLLGPRAHPVDGAGQDFLAGPALAGDEHRGVVARRRGWRDRAGPASPRLSLTTRSWTTVGAKAGAQLLDFLPELLALAGLAERHQHFIGPERLLEIVVRTLAHGGDGRIFVPVGAHHDEQGLALVRPVAAEEAESVHPGHAHVAEDQVEILDGRAGQRALGIAFRLDLIAGLAEQQRERLPEPGVVVNDQQPHRSHSLWGETP